MNHLPFALDFARRAGAIMRQNFRFGMKREWKSDFSPVTETDIAINHLIIGEVARNFPDHAVLAEEESAPRDGARFVWVCDPVDGTIPFSHGIPTCVFSLALCDDGVPVLGVLYDPFMDRLLHAEKGKGAFCNGTPLHVAQKRADAREYCMVAAARQFYDPYGVERELRSRGVGCLDFASITYAGLLVASGEFVCTVFGGIKSHDTAAMKVIIEEAGGRVTDIDGNEQRYDRDIKGHIASNGVMHDEIVAIVKKNRTDS